MANSIGAVGNLASAAKVSAKGDVDTLAFTIIGNSGNIATKASVFCRGRAGFAANILPFLTKGASLTVFGSCSINKNTHEKDVYNNIVINVSSLKKIQLGGRAQQQDSNGGGDKQAPEQRASNGSEQQAPAAQPAPDYDSLDDDIPF